VLDIWESREGFEETFSKSTTELEVESGIFFGARFTAELSHFGKKHSARGRELWRPSFRWNL